MQPIFMFGSFSKAGKRTSKHCSNMTPGGRLRETTQKQLHSNWLIVLDLKHVFTMSHVRLPAEITYNFVGMAVA